MGMPMRARLVPYSSVVGQAIAILGEDRQIVAQLAVMAPAGAPAGETHREFTERIARDVAAKINGETA